MKYIVLVIAFAISICGLNALTCSLDGSSCPSAEFCSIHCKQLGRKGGYRKWSSLENRYIYHCYDGASNKRENSDVLDASISYCKQQCTPSIFNEACINCLTLSDCYIMFGNTTLCNDINNAKIKEVGCEGASQSIYCTGCNSCAQANTQCLDCYGSCKSCGQASICCPVGKQAACGCNGPSFAWCKCK